MLIWDSANVGHIASHGVSPEEVEQVVANEPLDVENQVRNEEPRTLLLGETDAGRVLFIVVTQREEDLRVVTAWQASRRSRQRYIEQKELNDG